MGVFICQNPSNCNSKYMQFIVCQLCLNKTLKVLFKIGEVKVKSLKWCPTLSNHTWTIAHYRLLCAWFLKQEYCRWVAILSFSGILPTQGPNPGLLHCRETLYHMNHQGSAGERVLSTTWLYEVQQTGKINLWAGVLTRRDLKDTGDVALGRFKSEPTQVCSIDEISLRCVFMLSELFVGRVILY